MINIDDFSVLSLFDGMSCGQIALQRAGVHYDHYFASEIDKFALQVTNDNYPSTIQLGDIRDLRTSPLPNISLLIGGSSCQNFSKMGRSNGMISQKAEEITTLKQYLSLKSFGEKFEGQSFLFWEYVRILRELTPRYFLLENVKMSKKWQQVISDALGVDPILIDSNLVSAQNRARLYWTNIPNVTLPVDKKLFIKDILSESKIDITARFLAKKEGTLSFTKSRENLRGLDQKVSCMTSTGQNISNTSATNIPIGDRYYTLDATMVERAQTVPDGFTESVSRTQRLKMLGNGWTVDVIAHIFKGLKGEG